VLGALAAGLDPVDRLFGRLAAQAVALHGDSGELRETGHDRPHAAGEARALDDRDVAKVEERLADVLEAARGTAREHEVLRAEIEGFSLVDVVRQPLAQPRVSLRTAVHEREG